MKGTIERFEEAKKKASTEIQTPGYFYAPYVPKLITSVAVTDENGNAVTRYNLVDKDAMDIKFVINNLSAVRGNTSGKGRSDLVMIRCPRSGQIHELEFFAWPEEDNGGCYFMTTEESPTEEYLRIEETNGWHTNSRALFKSRKEVVDVLSSGKFWIRKVDWKKIVGFCPCWACFWVGHWVSKPFEHFDCLAFLYPVYNTLMLWSLDINDWAGLDAWQDATEHPRLRDMAKNYADMLYETGREEELKKALWIVPNTQEVDWGYAAYREMDPSKVSPELEKKMRRELIAYKRQKER